MWRALLLATVSLATSPQTAGAEQHRDIERWLESDAIPFVRQQLQEHPRFKGETVMFVVLDDKSHATTTSALALNLRDRLLDAVLDTPGITVGWRQGRNTAQSGTAPGDCEKDDVHYYFGIELKRQANTRYRASLRVLDLDEHNWVSGFGRTWQGTLDATQRRAANQRVTDSTFLGARDVPFSSDQNDLVARYLAHELSCALYRQTAGDYVVPADIASGDTLGLDSTIALVSNNVAANEAIELAADPAMANADITGKAHRIDEHLYQYWLTLTPRDGDGELRALTVSTYLENSGGPAADLPVLAPVRTLVAMPDERRGSLIAKSRFAGDAVVYFLQHQPYFGLVRLDNGECRARTRATVVRAGDPFRLPDADARRGSGEVLEIDQWFATPVRNTFYALAIADERAARRIANHLDRLPVRCGKAARPGLTGEELRSWLATLSFIAAAAGQHIDWRAVEVKDVL